MSTLTCCILETSQRVLLQTVKSPDEVQHNAAFHQGMHFWRAQINLRVTINCIKHLLNSTEDTH